MSEGTFSGLMLSQSGTIQSKLWPTPDAEVWINTTKPPEQVSHEKLPVCITVSWLTSLQY